MAAYVELYHPLIPSTVTSPIRVAASASFRYAERGWLPVDGAEPAPTDDPYYTKAASDSRYVRDSELAAQAAGHVTDGSALDVALRAALVPFWTPEETVAAGDIRVDENGQTIVRTSSGTTRATYDATEQSAWTIASGSGGGGGGLTTEQVQDLLDSTIVAGANVTKTYDDGAGTLTLAAAGGAPYTDEQVRDVIGAALVAGAGLTKTVSDAGDTITLESATLTQLGLKRDFGAVGDMRVVTDGVIGAGSTSLTSATANFTADDVGKTIAIPYAGPDNGTQTPRRTHVTTIAARVSATEVTLTAAPVNAMTAGRTVNDAAISRNNTTLTSATANFTQADVGKRVEIPDAGPAFGNSGSPLQTKITGYTNATTVTVAHRAVATVTGKTVALPGGWVGWGTDDTSALQAAADAGSAQGRPIEVEPGRYLTTTDILVGSRFNWVGHGAAVSVVSPVGYGIAAFSYVGAASAAAMLTDVWFRNFEIDCSGVRVNTYETKNKAIYVRPCRRFRVEAMYVHDSSATAIGSDWLPDSHIVNNVVEWGGSQVWEFGGGAGGSGIGIGTGLLQYEPITVMGNIVRNCGNNGIFTEAQGTTIRSRGIRIIGNHVAGCGGDGISDRACEGTIVAHNTVSRCLNGLSSKFGFISTLYSRAGIFEGNVVDTCQYGLTVHQLDGDLTIRGNRFYTSDTNLGPMVGIEIVDKGGTIESLVIVDNDVHDLGARGIWVKSACDRAYIERNRVRDTCQGYTTMSAITTELSIAVLYLRENIAYDTAASGKKQQYGFRATGGTIGRFEHWGNDFAGNAAGTLDTTGATITTDVTAPAAY